MYGAMNNTKPPLAGRQKKTICILATLLAATIVTALAFMIAFIVTLSEKGDKNCPNDDCDLVTWPPPSASYLGNFTRAAVATDSGVCSEIGRDVMIKGGNAVDATIAATFCIGVTDPHSCGLGGGHFMTIYNRTTKSCYIIDARETAPSFANWEMYVNISVDIAARGWNSIAIPGEVYGLWTAYTTASSGRIPWYDLVKPTIDLCRNGFVVSESLAKAIKNKTQFFLQEPSMKYLFFNNDTQRMYKMGDVMRRPLLAETLEALASSSDPISLFYKGNLTEKFMRDFKENNANMTAEDFANYSAKFGPLERPAITAEIAGTNLIACGPPPPSSAAIAISILKIMSQFNVTQPFVGIRMGNNVETYHRWTEAMKYAYAAREYLGDMDYLSDALELARNFTSDSFVHSVKLLISEQAQNDPDLYYVVKEPSGTAVAEDHGTSHVSVLDPEGNAASLTSTINLHFGSIRRSVSTDIIWNDDMDDFSTPGSENSFGFEPSPFNYIEPGKRPLSSMTPIVLYDKETGDVKTVAGGAGGSRIISATASVITRLLWFGENVKEAVDAPRLHNQLHPFETGFERHFPMSLVDQLIEKKRQNLTFDTDNAAVCVIHRSKDAVYANSDYRKPGGYPSGF